jgi:transposase
MAIPPMPEETQRVAPAIFPADAPLVRLHAAWGPLSNDPVFAAVFPSHGQPAATPWRLAVVTVFPFLEGLADRQAAPAVRTRIAGKYALRLELTDPGFASSVRSEFRTRLLAGQAEQRLLTVLWEAAKTPGWVRATGRQRPDSPPVLAAVRTLNRLEGVGETLRQALNVLAEGAPEGRRSGVAAEWYDRSSRRIEDYRLPQTKPARDV